MKFTIATALAIQAFCAKVAHGAPVNSDPVATITGHIPGDPAATDRLHLPGGPHKGPCGMECENHNDGIDKPAKPSITAPANPFTRAWPYYPEPITAKPTTFAHTVKVSLITLGPSTDVVPAEATATAGPSVWCYEGKCMTMITIDPTTEGKATSTGNPKYTPIRSGEVFTTMKPFTPRSMPTEQPTFGYIHPGHGNHKVAAPTTLATRG